jgi:hypothetical protein
MRRLLVLALAVTMISLTGCGKFKDIKINDAEIGKVSLYGIRGLDVKVMVEIDNPARQIKVSDIEADVKYCGKVLGRVTVDPFTLNGKTVQKYDLKARISLSENLSLYDMLMFLDRKLLDNCQLDISMNGKLRSGLSKTIKKTDVPLKKLIEYAEDKK